MAIPPSEGDGEEVEGGASHSRSQEDLSVCVQSCSVKLIAGALRTGERVYLSIEYSKQGSIQPGVGAGAAAVDSVFGTAVLGTDRHSAVRHQIWADILQDEDFGGIELCRVSYFICLIVYSMYAILL